MSNIAIKIEDLSKLYRLGIVSTGTLSHDMKRWWNMRIQGKEDPFLKIADTNNQSTKNESDFVWALKNITLEINQGDVVGIIGKNGAGKSTLLKILSKVTKPTTGYVKYKGRIASLLEVGTGFHPEMTGRENIFLNGAILGMTRKEINKKFDEIVSFAGIERYIDTPVKRYSSGMYVRLAFAVAAHLEPEILIIDEVLAVGDAEFQKKCLGKMGEVANQGRTILFVSHNITAINTLCKKGVLLYQGSIKEQGEISTVVNTYLQNFKSFLTSQSWSDVHFGNEYIKANYAKIQLENDNQILDVNTSFNIIFSYTLLQEISIFNLSLHLYDNYDNCIFNIGTKQSQYLQGTYISSCNIPGQFLNNGTYYISIMIVKDSNNCIFNFEKFLSFEINDNRIGSSWFGKWPGAIRPTFLNYTITQEL